jgi:hypothetical protein
MVAVGLAIFLPFFLWEGGSSPNSAAMQGGQMRPSSFHRNELSRATYEQGHPSKEYNPANQRGGYENPNANIIVTGQFVTD